MKKLNASIFIVLSTVLSIACSPENPKEEKVVHEKMVSENPIKAVPLDTFVSIAIAPVANGYEFSMHSFDINPWLKKYLTEFKSVQLVEIPLRKMNGSGFQGIYHKKDCGPILKQVQPDFLFLVWMKGEPEFRQKSENSWGYEVKVIDVKKDTAFILLSVSKLKSYEDIEEHFKNNISPALAFLKKVKYK